MDTESMQTQETMAQPRASEPPAEAVYIFPLSFAQQQLWLLDRLLAGRSVYNVPLVMRLVGPLEIGVLQRALQELIRRHEVLRTRFEMGRGRPVQVIAPDLTFSVDEEDLHAWSPEEREVKARCRAQEAVSQPFNLAR